MTRYVTRYVVTRVRREPSSDGTHTHIAGVFVGDEYFPRQQVIRSIGLLNDWVARFAGLDRPLVVVESCPFAACTDAPYIEAFGDVEASKGMSLLRDA